MNEKQLATDFLQLARIALNGRAQDIQLVIHRAAKKFRDLYPDMSEALIHLLQESPTRTSPLRKDTDAPLPVDVDSRLQLLRLESQPLETDPIFSADIAAPIEQVVSERNNLHSLLKLGLHPTKSMLFTGPPGLGKTMAARWIATRLGKPLLILDLAAVMSSYLGKTGNNIRFVLDYAKSMDCVLLLDELDAIAKRRDDQGEIGELKRLVTVLLQEIDDWPSSGLLIAATNHPDLLDPAIWRRFESIVTFNYPQQREVEKHIQTLLRGHIEDNGIWSKILSFIFLGRSYSEIQRQITQARKASVVNGIPLQHQINAWVESINGLTHEQKIDLAVELEKSGTLPQRRVTELTGIARDTIRNHLKKRERKN